MIRRARQLLGILAVLLPGLGSCADATGPRAALQVEVVGGNAQTAAAGQALAAPLAVVVRDGSGDPLVEVPVRWSTIAGSGSISPTLGFTDADGRAVARWTLGTRAGEQAARVSVSGANPLTLVAHAVPAEPASVRLAADTLRLAALDDTLHVTAEVRDTFGNLIPDPPLRLLALDAAIAHVEGGVFLRARGNGTTHLVAQAGARADTTVIVVRQEVSAITLTERADSVLVGDSIRFQALLTDANGHAIEDRQVDWVSTDPGIAQIDAAGTLRALSSGRVTLRAVADAMQLETVVAVHAPRFRLTQRAVTLDAIGAESAVAGLYRGRPAAPQRLRLVGERRWLGETPVLDAAALSRQRVIASGAGTALVEALVDGAAPDTLMVRVAPASPLAERLVLPAPGGAGPVRLRGYAMHLVDADRIRANGEPVVAVARDTATIELHLPSVPNLACGTGSPIAITVDGAQQRAPLVIDLPSVAPLRLQPGEAAPLTEVQRGCLRFEASTFARYALVLADARAVERSRGQFADPVGTGPATLRVRGFADRLSAPPDAPRRVQPPVDWSAPHSGHRVVGEEDVAGAADWRLRDRAWGANERMAVAVGPNTETVHVVRVYAGGFVLATADTAGAHVHEWITRVDSAMAIVKRHGVPVLQQSLSLTRPASSPSADQLLIVAARSVAQAETHTYLPAGTDERAAPQSLIVLPEEGVRGASIAELVELIMHPLAYAWQARYLYASSPNPRSVDLQVAHWAREGTATLYAQETLRRAAGLPLLANLDWEQALRQPSPLQRAYLIAALRATGHFARGETHAASFLRDLVMRRVVFGNESIDHALREVTRGAIDGWHGLDRAGNRRAGLTRRMQERLGSGWDPARALAVWGASQVLDDRVQNPQFQNPAFLFAWRETAPVWQPLARVTGGVASAFEASLPPGSVQFLLLDDSGTSGSLLLESDADDLVWLAARIY
jgi:hypothetical protein